MSDSRPFLIRGYNKSKSGEQDIHSSYNGMKAITLLHERIHNGKVWLHSENHYNLANSASIDNLIIPTSGGSADLHLHHAGFNSTLGPSEMTIYEAPFTDANSLGTQVTSTYENRNRRLTSNDRGFTAYNFPFIDVNSLGRQLDYILLESSAGGPVKAAGGGVAASTEIVLDNTKQYLIRFTNRASSVNSFVEEKILMYRADD